MSHEIFDAIRRSPVTLDRLTRAQLIELCAWNDRNGVWTDEQSDGEGMARATVADLRAIILDWIQEG